MASLMIFSKLIFSMNVYSKENVEASFMECLLLCKKKSCAKKKRECNSKFLILRNVNKI